MLQTEGHLFSLLTEELNAAINDVGDVSTENLQQQKTKTSFMMPTVTNSSSNSSLSREIGPGLCLRSSFTPVDSSVPPSMFDDPSQASTSPFSTWSDITSQPVSSTFSPATTDLKSTSSSLETQTSSLPQAGGHEELVIVTETAEDLQLFPQRRSLFDLKQSSGAIIRSR